MKACLEPLCGNFATYRGRCPAHQPTKLTRKDHGETLLYTKAIYNSRRWQVLRAYKLARSPLCECPICAADLFPDVATEVDHITPITEGGAPYDLANLQSLSKAHHSRKTNLEVRSRKFA